jgi:hypothetical protein
MYDAQSLLFREGLAGFFIDPVCKTSEEWHNSILLYQIYQNQFCNLWVNDNCVVFEIELDSPFLHGCRPDYNIF